ncbi:hypothetical protein OR1_00744 [Geobacter sp. OR-1]|nr:hypothetical protein OR1_00744 [Geobacter sp. OR-1]
MALMMPAVLSMSNEISLGKCKTEGRTYTLSSLSHIKLKPGITGLFGENSLSTTKVPQNSCGISLTCLAVKTGPSLQT